MLIQRRNFLIGLGALIAAPAIVRLTSIMPVKAIVLPRHPLYDSNSYQALREGFYGRSPLMDALPSVKEIQDRMSRLMASQNHPSTVLFKWRDPVAPLENYPGMTPRA